MFVKVTRSFVGFELSTDVESAELLSNCTGRASGWASALFFGFESSTDDGTVGLFGNDVPG